MHLDNPAKQCNTVTMKNFSHEFQKQVDEEFIESDDYVNEKNIHYFRGTQSYHFWTIHTALMNLYNGIKEEIKKLIKHV